MKRRCKCYKNPRYHYDDEGHRGWLTDFDARLHARAYHEWHRLLASVCEAPIGPRDKFGKRK